MDIFCQLILCCYLIEKIHCRWNGPICTEYYSSPPKNDIFFALVLTYRISLGSFFSLYFPFFLVLDKKPILNIAYSKSFCLKIHNNKAFKGIVVFVQGRTHKVDKMARYASSFGLSAMCHSFVMLSGATWHHAMRCAAARLWSPSSPSRNTSHS